VWTLDQQAAYAKQGNWPTAGNVNPDAFIENLFSTYLYTGNGSTQTITNGIDLAGKGGLVWLKSRTVNNSHILTDTARGVANTLYTNTTGAQNSLESNTLSAFNSNGFGLNNSPRANDSGALLTSWTFREQPKFFDVVTYTGNGVDNRDIPHSLGSTPGCIIVKCTNSTPAWRVWHTSLTAGNNMELNATDGQFADTSIKSCTDTTFRTNSGSNSNGAGNSYVAYLFAHNAGGFGLSGSENVISCGSFTTDGSGLATVNLGYEPQWVMVKRTDSTSGWYMQDIMRGYTADATSGTDAYLFANTSAAEVNTTAYGGPNATGFTAYYAASATYIYIAIRRGPMAVPTTGTSVFSPVRYTTSPEGFITGFPVDFGIAGNAAGTDKWYWQSRLQGAVLLSSASTAAEVGSGSAKFDMMNGYGTGFSTAYYSTAFRRSPGFFDVVCYTGTGSATTFAHNLAAVPELMFVKSRSNATGWTVYSAPVGATGILVLNGTNAVITSSTSWNDTAPTSSVFTVGTDNGTNGSARTFVAYLFATVAGVSKVGSYTGTGAAQTINCGFTGGSRFVLIKRTDSTGDWYVWDSARGIIPSNDPYLLLNSTAAEVTGTDYVDTSATGFDISSTAPAAINASGGTFIFLAIA
jgi:hypothetical protein